MLGEAPKGECAEICLPASAPSPLQPPGSGGSLSKVAGIPVPSAALSHPGGGHPRTLIPRPHCGPHAGAMVTAWLCRGQGMCMAGWREEKGAGSPKGGKSLQRVLAASSRRDPTAPLFPSDSLGLRLSSPSAGHHDVGHVWGTLGCLPLYASSWVSVRLRRLIARSGAARG